MNIDALVPELWRRYPFLDDESHRVRPSGISIGCGLAGSASLMLTYGLQDVAEIVDGSTMRLPATSPLLSMNGGSHSLFATR